MSIVFPAAISVMTNAQTSVTPVMAARSATILALCRTVVVAILIRVATPSGERDRQSRSTDPQSDLEPESTFILDIGTGRRRLPVAMSAANVRRLSTEEMFRKLGHHFDPDWMAVDRPAVLATSGSGFNRSRDDPELVRDLRRLRFTYADEPGAERRLSAAVVVQLERWLLELARCEVLYTWEDMGELFWPRWVRHGRCDSLAVCSWPPGMYCAPAPSDTLRLLHWQCRRRADRGRVARHNEESSSSSLFPRPGNRQARRHRLRNGRQPTCRWKRVPYPVTSECFCSC